MICLRPASHDRGAGSHHGGRTSKPRLSAGLVPLYLAQAFPVTLAVRRREGRERPVRASLGMLSTEFEDRRDEGMNIQQNTTWEESKVNMHTELDDGKSSSLGRRPLMSGGRPLLTHIPRTL